MSTFDFDFIRILLELTLLFDLVHLICPLLLDDSDHIIFTVIVILIIIFVPYSIELCMSMTLYLSQTTVSINFVWILLPFFDLVLIDRNIEVPF